MISKAINSDELKYLNMFNKLFTFGSGGAGLLLNGDNKDSSEFVAIDI